MYKKKIKKGLLLSNMYPSEKDPAYGIFVKNFKDQMGKSDFDFSTTVIISGCNINSLKKLIKYIKYFFVVIYNIKKNDYDFIYVHYIAHSLIPLLFVKKYINKPLFINAHGNDVIHKHNYQKFIGKIVSPIIKVSDLIIVPSYYFKDIVQKRFQIRNGKVFVSPSAGVDTAIFRPKKKETESNKFVIGYVSRIDNGKGWDVLLKSAKLLLDNNINNFKLVMVGGGRERKQFIKMISDFNLEDHVDYTGSLPQKDLVDYYNLMDVFVFPTTRLAESLGLVGLEAMACGVPVIGSNIGGLQDYIVDEYNGRFFAPNNSNKLFDRIKEFISMDAGERAQYKKNALKTSRAYDKNIVSKRLKEKLLEFL